MIKDSMVPIVDSEVNIGKNYAGYLEITLRIKAKYLYHSTLIATFRSLGWVWENSASYYVGEYDSGYLGNLYFSKEY